MVCGYLSLGPCVIWFLLGKNSVSNLKFRKGFRRFVMIGFLASLHDVSTIEEVQLGDDLWFQVLVCRG